MQRDVEVPEELARAVAMHLTSHPDNEIICLGIDAVREVLAEVAAPAIRSQEGQRVREAIKAEAKHLRKLARQYDQPTRYELQEASRRVEALAALDSLEDEDGSHPKGLRVEARERPMRIEDQDGKRWPVVGYLLRTDEGIEPVARESEDTSIDELEDAVKRLRAADSNTHEEAGR